LTFVDEFCSVGDGFIAREVLYQNYKAFCQDSGMKAMSQTRFNAELEGNFTEIKRGQDKVSSRKVWRGISFVDGGKE
jgi:putative DNA primase/helicase